MDTIVEKLLEIQDKDIRIFNLLKQIESVPAEKDKILNVVIEAEKHVAAAKEEFMALESNLKEVEIEIASMKEKIRALQSKSAEVKKNDEYRALLKEIEQWNAKVVANEDIQLEYWEKLETTRERREKERKALLAAKSRVDAVIQDLETRVQNCQKQVEKVTGERDRMLSTIPKPVKQRYHRLISRPNRTQNFQKALVPIQVDGCGGCFLKVTPQVRALVRKGELTPCENCGTLLYYA